MAQITLTRELVSYALARSDSESLESEILRLAEASAFGFAIEAAEMLANQLEGRLSTAESQESLLAALARHTSPLSFYLSACILALRGELDRALDKLSRAIVSLPRPDASMLALRARWCLRKQDHAQAGADLKLALQTHPSYPFYVRTERLIDKVVASAAFTPKREIRLALLASSTTALLAPVLRSAFFARGVKVVVYEGAFGNYQQEILDTGSALYSFRPQLVVLLTNTRDLNLPPNGGTEQAARFCRELRGLWNHLQQRNPCHIVQLGFEVERSPSWGSLESTLPDGRARALRLANDSLSQQLPLGVSFLDISNVPIDATADCPREWHSSKQYPGSAALPAFADAIVAHGCSVLGIASKVLVLDLDNTLWGGVIGEDGLGGIKIGPPSAEGEGYQALQRYIKELKARGILLAVCSKNNPAEAELPFREHESMLLRLEDFAAFRANWNDKGSNLRALAQELSLGLDSFVFLDDNPFERNWVRDAVPSVTVLEGGTTPWDMLSSLKRGMYFENVALTQEDTERSLSYQVNASMRQAGEAGEHSLETFLTSLHMVARCSPVESTSLQRVTQLINKTNQFNLTNHRFSAEQVKEMVEGPDWWFRAFRLADRFGDHGLIGVLSAGMGAETWTIDTWLMSCRVLGRRMEDFMCAQVITAAAQGGAKRVIGRYVPSEKNALVAELYVRMGFTQTGEPNEYEFSVGDTPVPPSPWIHSSPP